MGLFARNKGDREVMLKRNSYRSHQGIPTIRLKDSEEENAARNSRQASKKMRNPFKRIQRKPTFRRLNEVLPSPKDEYTPPPGFIAHSPLVTAKTKSVDTPKSAANERTPLKERKAHTLPNKLERKPVDHFQTLATMSSSVCEYEPPAFGLTNLKTGQSDMQSTKVGDQDQEYRQFVFDPSFQKIEKVSVERSDPGAPDLSEFMKAATKFDMTPPSHVKNAKAREAAKSTASADPKVIHSSKKPKSLKKKSSGPSLIPGITAEALAKQEKLSNDGPPRMILTSSDHSMASNVSVANATIINSVSDAFPRGHPFHSMDDQGNGRGSDPFKVAAWDSDNGNNFADWKTPKSCKDPFAVAPSFGFDPTEKSAGNANDALINSIMKAASKGRKKALEEEGKFKPDPTPRGDIPFSSSDSFVDFSSRRFPTDREAVELRLSNSDTVLEQHQESIGPQKKPPKGLPNNAILGSMIYRQAFAEPELSKSTAWNSENIYEPYDEESVNSSSLGDVPIDILASESHEMEKTTVSSITEEASSFYQRSFDGWNKQAQSVLNHWHQTKIQEARNPNSYRADAPPQQKSGGSKKEQLQSATAEHINMFSA